jgi:hypothetical protein
MAWTLRSIPSTKKKKKKKIIIWHLAVGASEGEGE